MTPISRSILACIPGSGSTLPASRVDEARRRITPAAGRALEKLGHTIEYLSDLSMHDAGPLRDDEGCLQAIEILLALNLAVYFECPEVPTLGERLRALIRRLA